MGDIEAGVTVVGAGGIGCALGCALRTGGVDVLFVDIDPAKLEWGRRNGVAVDVQTPQSADFVDFQRWSPSLEDLVLLCTKCYDNREGLEPNLAWLDELTSALTATRSLSS